jgi:hypothetical protein
MIFDPISGLWLPEKPRIERPAPFNKRKVPFVIGAIPGAGSVLKAVGAPAPGAEANFFNLAVAAGLGTGLKLCHDIGSAACYPGTGQIVTDLTGVTADFFLGTTNGAEASDPTPTGTPGALTSGEYMALDGGDVLTLGAANPAHIQNLHKDGALFTFAAWVYLGSLAGVSVFGTNGGNATSGTGVHLALTSPGALNARCVGSGTTELDVATAGSFYAATAWQLMVLSIDEAAGGTASFMGVNGVYHAFDGTYASPVAGDASFAMQISGRGNSNQPLPSGSRYAGGWLWEGVALSQANATTLFNATKGRFGL